MTRRPDGGREPLSARQPPSPSAQVRICASAHLRSCAADRAARELRVQSAYRRRKRSRSATARSCSAALRGQLRIGAAAHLRVASAPRREGGRG